MSNDLFNYQFYVYQLSLQIWCFNELVFSILILADEFHNVLFHFLNSFCCLIASFSKSGRMPYILTFLQHTNQIQIIFNSFKKNKDFMVNSIKFIGFSCFLFIYIDLFFFLWRRVSVAISYRTKVWTKKIFTSHYAVEIALNLHFKFLTHWISDSKRRHSRPTELI